jgi:hypothetical protein
MSREQFAAEENWEMGHLQYGVELRDPARRAARLASRMASFDRVAADPLAAIERYQVRYVALPLPAGSRRPAALGADWDVVQAGASWVVWERPTQGGAAPLRPTVTGRTP